MFRLSHVILFTPGVERLRRFYRDRIGIAVARQGHGWVALRPSGAALWLHELGERHRKEVAFALHVGDLDAAVMALRAHGTQVTERENDALFGRVAYFRDPEGNLVDLHPSRRSGEPGAAPALSAVVLNCRDVEMMEAFYRDVIGLPLRHDATWWAQFETGDTTLALHPRQELPGRSGHHRGPITLGFTPPSDLESFVRKLEKRGLVATSAPRSEGLRTFAGAVDPDGNAIVLQGPVEPAAEVEEPVDPPPRGKPRRSTKKRAASRGSSTAKRPSTSRRGAAARSRPRAPRRRAPAKRRSRATKRVAARRRSR